LVCVSKAHDNHWFFMDALGGTHARTMLFSRFKSFIQSLTRSQNRAVTGQNIRYILNVTKNDDIIKINVKKRKREFRLCSMKKEDEWKPVFIKKLTDLKYSCTEIPCEEDELHVEDWTLLWVFDFF
jgi:hypothetical protein